MENKIPNYKIKSIIIIAISLIISFLGVVYGNNSNIALFIPLGLLVAVFFIGYQVKGEVKNGIRWVVSVVVLFGLFFLISYILKK